MSADLEVPRIAEDRIVLPLTARWLGSVGQSERGGVNAIRPGEGTPGRIDTSTTNEQAFI
jgi:hypothetical protein